MGLNRISLHYSIPLIALLFAFSNSEGYAGDMGPAEILASSAIYVGVFGGWGSSNSIDIDQYGTAFFTVDRGGPLAVNAFGSSDRSSAGFVGGHIGYQWAPISSCPFFQWGIVPAAELEGYYLGKNNLIGNDLTDINTRLNEHDFDVIYPMSTGVFLTNAVLNFNPSSQCRFHPYLAGGIGAAVIHIFDAVSTQVAPAEPGVNHYSANPNDKDTTFAAQAKLGLNFDLCHNMSLFIEYRWLYLANSSYTFGSTIAPGHAPTSPWLVELDSQKYNMGAVGIQYRI